MASHLRTMYLRERLSRVTHARARNDMVKQVSSRLLMVRYIMIMYIRVMHAMLWNGM
jgi:hypothetical protein